MMEEQRAKTPKADVESASVSRVDLRLEPKRLPVLTVTDGRGVVESKSVGLLELLRLLDHSTVWEAVRELRTRRVDIPPLPPNTILASARETPTEESFSVTAWLPPRRWALLYGDLAHVIGLPTICYRVDWSEGAVRALYLALAPWSAPVPVYNTELYRWPFSNVFQNGQACWHPNPRHECELRDAASAVAAFMAVENNLDLYRLGASQNSGHEKYEHFLAAAANEGLRSEWLIPLGLTAEGLHNQ